MAWGWVWRPTEEELALGELWTHGFRARDLQAMEFPIGQGPQDVADA